MYLLTQGESSVSSVQPAKRKRGRPRKFETLTTPEVAHTPVLHGLPHKVQTLTSPDTAHTPASVGMKECLPSRTRGPEPLLGQAITGVVEAASDSGYLLSLKFGNTSMRGVAFRPGHCVPVSTENDVAPNIATIKRRKKRAQTASKQKCEPPKTIASSSKLRISNHGDEDVEMVESLLMLLPPVQNNTQDGQIEDGKEALESSEEIERITELIKAFQEDVNEGEMQGDESTSLTTAFFDEIMKAETVAVVQEEKDNSSQTLDGEIEVEMEALKSSAENGGITELFKALQEDVNEGEVQGDESTSLTKALFDEIMKTETVAVVQEEKDNSSQTLDGEIEVDMEALKSSAENGGITELFKALQEDVNEGEVQGDESTSLTKALFDEIMKTETVVGQIFVNEIEDEMELESSAESGGISEPFKEVVNEGALQIGGESTAVIEAEFYEIMTTEADIPQEVPVVVGLPITDTAEVVQEDKDNSSQTLDSEIVDEMELESSAESGGISKPFKALQEDVNEGEVQTGDESTSVSQAEFDEMMTSVVDVGQIFVNEISQGVPKDDGFTYADATAVLQEVKDNTRGSSQTLHGEIKDGKEVLKSSSEKGGVTEFFKEDVNVGELQIGRESTSVTQAEFDKIMTTEANGVSQIFVNEITPKVRQDDDGSSNTDTTAVAQEKMEYTGGSLQTLDGETEVGKATLKSSAGNTDILKDDVIENKVQGGDKSTSVTEAEFDVTMATEADCKDESIVP